MPDITIRQVAEAAGVSPATASLALRASPKISTTTIARVKRVAHELGYRPHPMVSALMARQRMQKSLKSDKLTSTIAFITPHKVSHLLTQMPWDAPAEVYHGALEHAKDLGYGLTEISYPEQKLSGARLNNILLARGILGLILSEIPDLEALKGIEWDRFALVSIGTHTVNPALTHVQSDHYENTALAMEKVLSLGYRRPGLALRPYLNIATRNRYVAAFLHAQLKLPIEQRTTPLFCPLDQESLFHEWIHREKPDVVLTGNYRMLKWIENAGYPVPEAMGMVHLDVSPDKSNCAGIHQQRAQIGAEAVDTLVAQLYRNDRGPHPTPKGIYIESDWVPGQTLRARKV